MNYLITTSYVQPVNSINTHFKTLSFFYFELSNILNSLFNIGEPIPNSKVVRKILRSLPGRFRPKVIVIEESKDSDSIRVDELVGSIQTYEMNLPNSHNPKDSAFKVFENEEKDIEMPKDITHDELAHMPKRIKRAMRFNKMFYKNQELGKRKGPNEQTSNEKGKGSFKDKKVEFFNYGGVGHYS